jgi:hypothetical protein
MASIFLTRLATYLSSQETRPTRTVAHHIDSPVPGQPKMEVFKDEPRGQPQHLQHSVHLIKDRNTLLRNTAQSLDDVYTTIHLLEDAGVKLRDMTVDRAHRTVTLNTSDAYETLVQHVKSWKKLRSAADSQRGLSPS